MTIGIHAYQTTPVEVQAAIWYPDDDYQRAAVLGWLLHFPNHDIVKYEYGQVLGGLYLYLADGDSVYVQPGHYIVGNPETGVITAVDPVTFAKAFSYVYSPVDPNQPPLF